MFFQTSAPGCRETDGVPDHAGEQQHVKVLSHPSHPLSDQRSGWSALAGLPGKHPHCFTTHAPPSPSFSSSSASFSFGSETASISLSLLLSPSALSLFVFLLLTSFNLWYCCSSSTVLLEQYEHFTVYISSSLTFKPYWDHESLSHTLTSFVSVYFSLTFSPTASLSVSHTLFYFTFLLVGSRPLCQTSGANSLPYWLVATATSVPP